MNNKQIKQACINYICGIEKEALDVGAIVDAGKGILSSDIGKKIVGAATSDVGKKVLSAAGTGAFVGSATAKGQNGQPSSIGDRVGGAIKGGLLGGSLVGAGAASGKLVGMIPKAPIVTASEAIDGLYIDKIAEDQNTKPDNQDPNQNQMQSPNQMAPKVPQVQPTLNPGTAGKINDDMDVDAPTSLNNKNAFETIEIMFDKIAEEQEMPTATIVDNKSPLTISEKTELNILQDKLNRGNRLDSNSLDKYELFIKKFIHNATKMINPQDKIALFNILLPKLRKGMASSSDIRAIKTILDNIQSASMHGKEASDSFEEAILKVAEYDKKNKEKMGKIPGTSEWIEDEEDTKEVKKDKKKMKK